MKIFISYILKTLRNPPILYYVVFKARIEKFFIKLILIRKIQLLTNKISFIFEINNDDYLVRF